MLDKINICKKYCEYVAVFNFAVGGFFLYFLLSICEVSSFIPIYVIFWLFVSILPIFLGDTKRYHEYTQKHS